MKFIIASENRGKIREIAEILREAIPDAIVAQPEIPLSLPPEEDDYTANAIAKALAAATATGLPSLADDSGLEVDALHGAPGVRSARYGTSDADRISRLLADLERFPGLEQRAARFRCVAAAAYPDERTITAEAVWEGFILRVRRGTSGFGYDPIFWDPKYEKSAAEFSALEKQKLSHRGKAFRLLSKQILPHFGGR